MEKFDVTKHLLVPVHRKLSEAEAKKFIEEKKVTLEQLPRILITDAAIKGLKPKPGDIIQIERNSPTSGKTYFYRVVCRA